jgi:hypothetical protein
MGGGNLVSMEGCQKSTTDTKGISQAWRIPDDLWQRIEPLLPKRKRRRGRGAASSKKKGAPTSACARGSGRNLLCLENRLSMEGSSSGVRFRQHAAQVFSRVDRAGGVPQTVETRPA